MPDTMPNTQPKPKANNALLITLAIIALIGLLAAWDALARYGEIIAAIYAAAAILSALGLLTLFMVRVVCSIQTFRGLHSLRQEKAKAAEITLSRETKLEETRVLTDARKMKASARKAEREAQLFVIQAPRDHQVLINDDDVTQKFTAAHLQLSGTVNGKPTPPTPEQTAAWSAFHSRSQAAAAPLLQEPATPQAELPAIIPALVNRQRILIVGASDAGKTTLLRWIIDSRKKCLVIDPHGSPGKWGEAKQIGVGLDYSRIAMALPQLLVEMKKRYEQLGRGEILEGQHIRLTIIVEEAMGIVRHYKEAGKQISSLLTDGRKVGLDLIATSQSRYVEPLGLKGEGDLRKGYVIVGLSGGNGEPHRATLEFNADGNETEHRLPGPHPDIEAAKEKAEAAEKIETDLESILAEEPEMEMEPTPKQKRAETIRALYNEGRSKTQIAQHFNKPSNSGAIFYEIRNALTTTTTA